MIHVHQKMDTVKRAKDQLSSLNERVFRKGARAWPTSRILEVAKAQIIAYNDKELGRCERGSRSGHRLRRGRDAAQNHGVRGGSCGLERLGHGPSGLQGELRQGNGERQHGGPRARPGAAHTRDRCSCPARSSRPRARRSSCAPARSSRSRAPRSRPSGITSTWRPCCGSWA